MYQIGSELIHTPVSDIFIILLLTAGYYFFEGRVIYLLASRYNTSFDTINGIECSLYCSFIGMITFGSGSGFAELYYLNKHDIDIPLTVSMSLTQYMVHRVAITIYGLIGYLLYYNTLSTLLGSYSVYLVIGCAAAVLFVGLLILVISSRKFSGLVFRLAEAFAKRKTSWSRLVNKAKSQVEKLQKDGKELLKNKRKLFILLFYDLVKLTFIYLIPFYLCRSGGELDLGLSISVTALIYMLIGIIPVPSHLGTTEFLFILFFVPLIGKGKAVSVLLLFRFATSILPFIAGSLCNLTFKRRLVRWMQSAESK